MKIQISNGEFKYYNDDVYCLIYMFVIIKFQFDNNVVLGMIDKQSISHIHFLEQYLNGIGVLPYLLECTLICNDKFVIAVGYTNFTVAGGTIIGYTKN